MAMRRKRTVASRLAAPKKSKINTYGMDPDLGNTYPTSPIKVQKTQTDGNAVNFTATTDTVTAYDGVVDLQDFDFIQAQTYEVNGADPMAGGLSEKEDGERIRTTKVNRSRFGVIMSTPEDVAASTVPYVVPLVKHVWQAQSYLKVVDTSISQLKRVPKEITKPKQSPVIQLVQCYPGFGTLDGQFSDGYSIQVLPELGEPSLQIAANNTLVLRCKAIQTNLVLGYLMV